MQGQDVRMAAVYHFKLRRAILVGFRGRLQKDGIRKGRSVGMLEADFERESLPTHHLTSSTGEVLKFQTQKSLKTLSAERYGN